MTTILPYNPENAEEAKQRTKEWLRGVYKKELGREIGQEGLDYWTKDIHDSGQTRNQVLSNIRRSNEKWLGDTYRIELGRELGDEGRDYWMKDMREGGQSREDVLANIRRSDEYKTYQAGDQPDPSDPTDPSDPIEYADNPWEEPRKTPTELAYLRSVYDSYDPGAGSIHYRTPTMTNQ